MNERSWTTRRDQKIRKLERIAPYIQGKLVATDEMVSVLEQLIEPGDRVILEGDNQKQADFLARMLVQVDPKRVHDLHLIMPSVERKEHLDLFDLGIASQLDFSFAGPQSVRMSQMIEAGRIDIGAIHTYLELYGRLFVDLIPNVALIAADQADEAGNLYTGYNTEDTPTIAEATAFKDGIVIAQVNEIVDEVSRVDIPSTWVDVIVVADEPYELEPLFTRDPQHITELHILMAMMALKGIYQKYGIQTLNHGIGFNTAAIELILPTFGASLGMKGSIAKHWVLNPHPTLIPAIESGFVETIHSFGSEVGMEDYIAARPDIFFVGSDGHMRSNRTMAQVAGQYAVDLFIGSALQMDPYGNTSTVTQGRLTGFGGAPNMGSDPRGRRHASQAWLDLKPDHPLAKGRKLVVQMVETFGADRRPVFVSELDAVTVKDQAHLDIVPIMIYGDDTTHVVTEEGIAYLYKTTSISERRSALSAIAGVTPLGEEVDRKQVQFLRERGIVALPEDLGIQRTQAKRTLLAAKSIEELVDWSGGLYHPPSQFRSWS